VNKTKITTIVGTRPEIIRMSEIVKLLDKSTEHRLIHTGQNPAPELNSVFFDDLKLRKPDCEFQINPSSLGNYLANMFPLIEKEFIDHRPHGILILGDTNSALCAIIAKRMGIPVFHLEAGNRSFDSNVPEEINRKIVDHTSDFNLPYSEIARQNLLNEGLHPRFIAKMGSPLFEILKNNEEAINNSGILQQLGYKPKTYFLASIHRQENVDFADRLTTLLTGLAEVSRVHKAPILISTHPRTRKRINQLNLKLDGELIFHDPFGFNDYIYLQKNAKVVLSDSGTISEESAILGFPAVTLRNSMERPEALESGVILMSGIDARSILESISYVISKTRQEDVPEEYFYPDVSQRVVNLVLSTVHQIPSWKGLYQKGELD
jgi:UDP-N-acetylglucosamine 2-epimerase (non-hydrolysing)